MEAPEEIAGLKVTVIRPTYRYTVWELLVGNKYRVGVDYIHISHQPDVNGNLFNISVSLDNNLEWTGLAHTPDMLGAWVAIRRWVREQEQQDATT